MVEIVRKKTEIVRLSKKGNSSQKNTINPNDKKSNYFLFRKVEPFPHYPSKFYIVFSDQNTQSLIILSDRNTYQSNIKKYRSALQSLEESKSSRDIRTIEELLEYYCELDDAFYFFERALSEMFHYDSQPILEDYQAVIGERDGVREVLLQPSPDGELSDEEYLELCDRERTAHEEVSMRIQLIFDFYTFL